jgi:hypothetical protein
MPTADLIEMIAEQLYAMAAQMQGDGHRLYEAALKIRTTSAKLPSPPSSIKINLGKYGCPLCGKELAFRLSTGSTGMHCYCGFSFCPSDMQNNATCDALYAKLQEVIARLNPHIQSQCKECGGLNGAHYSGCLEG